MPIFQLGKQLLFPPPERAEDGLLAVGGDLSVERLLLAYRSGIFPWYSQGEPILWWSPDPRAVLDPRNARVSQRLRRTIRSGRYRVSADTAFAEVIRACAEVPRPGQRGTWITAAMQRAYIRLHELGYAHSFETWRDGELAGGLYGVSLGAVFFGESMFARESDASKVALTALCDHCTATGIELIDSQVGNPHMQRMGAYDIPRAEYLQRLQRLLAHPTQEGSWTYPPGGADPPD